MIDQEFHGGQDNEFTPPLAERARVERFERPPSEEAPRREESAFSAQGLRDAEAEDAHREQRRRRAMKSRPLVQVTAAAMAVVVTGGVAMQPVPLPEPVAEIVEVIETPEPTEEPGIIPPDDVRAWLDKMMALCEADAEDETLFAEMRPDTADAVFSWWTEHRIGSNSFYYDGAVHKNPCDSPALSLDVWLDALSTADFDFSVRYVRTGSSYNTGTEGILLFSSFEHAGTYEWVDHTEERYFEQFGRSKGTVRNWFPLEGESFSLRHLWEESSRSDMPIPRDTTESTSFSGSYNWSYLENGTVEYSTVDRYIVMGNGNAVIGTDTDTDTVIGTVHDGVLTIESGCTVEEQEGEDGVRYGLWLPGNTEFIGAWTEKSVDALLYHHPITWLPLYSHIFLLP